MNKAISYRRCSTTEQGNSALGLEAQSMIIDQFCGSNNLELMGDYVEVVSGGKSDMNDRAELANALQHAKRLGATLVVARIDRISRDMELIANFLNRGIRFVSCEGGLNQSAFEIYLRGIFATEERRKISERTKNALQALKDRGVKLGNPPKAKEYLAKGRATRSAKASQFAERMLPILRALQADGNTSYSALARSLNERSIPTSTGGRWQATTVKRLLARMETVEP